MNTAADSSTNSNATFSSIEQALRYLQRQFASVEGDQYEWSQQKAELTAQVEKLKAEKEVHDQLTRDLLLRCRMLEYALATERQGYLSSDKPSSSSKNKASLKPKDRPTPKTNPRKAAPSKTKSPPAAPAISRIKTPQSNVVSSPNIAVPNSPAITPPGTPPVIPSSVKKREAASCSFHQYKLKLKLSGHLDSVRTVAFHPTDAMLASGSDDGTLKIWNLSKSSKKGDVEPVRTFRGHSGAITSVSVLNTPTKHTEIFGNFGFVAAAGRDGCVSFWKMPSTETTASPIPYKDYRDACIYHKTNAHEDIIWDLATHELQQELLMTASADGSVRCWNITPDELSLVSKITAKASASSSHSADGLLVPTSVINVATDLKTCAIGYTASYVGHFDTHADGKLITMLRDEKLKSVKRDSQVNQIVSHPTMPIIIAAHRDCTVRIYDLRSGSCEHRFVAHKDASVSSVSVDDTGLYVATGGQDGSLRYWDLKDKTCLHEVPAHRAKNGDALSSLTFHPKLGMLATSGGDSLIKIFQ